MFDMGFSEIMVIGVVALIVIGPERLPKVARTVGLLLGRVQRYVATVKSDLSQEMQLDELRRTGQAFKEGLQNSGQQISNEVDNIQQSVADSVTPQQSEPEPALTAQQQTETIDNPQGELALEPLPMPISPPRNTTADLQTKNNHTA